MKRNCLIVFTLLLCSSCSFNRQFYRGDKLPAGLKQITIAVPGEDTTYIKLDSNHQPTFTDNSNNQLPLPYATTSINFPNRSGHLLTGWFIKPISVRHPATTILFCHGNGGNILTEFWSAAQLATQGFQVFLFDYSGYGYSEGKPTRKRVLWDVNDALTMIRNREDVKGTKVVIYGQSMGGQLACVSAAENEALTDGMVAEGAISSSKDIAAHLYKPIGFLARVMVRNQYSSVRAIEHYHKPVLIVHSTEDKTAPFYMGEKIYRHANQPKALYPIGHGHIQGLHYYADSIAARIYGMLNQ